MTTTPDRTYANTTVELCQRIDGLTARMIQQWAEFGFLDKGTARPGTGHPRHWTTRQVQIIKTIYALRQAGVQTRAAGAIAQSAIDAYRAPDADPDKVRFVKVVLDDSPHVAFTLNLDGVLR